MVDDNAYYDCKGCLLRLLVMPVYSVSNACYGGITMPVYYSKLCLLTE